MNYLFPATVFLLGLLMFQYARAGRITSKQWPLYWLLCLLAGSSVEQYALMFIGVMTLMLGMDLLSKKKNAYPIWVGYIMSIVGLLILVLAPGNFVRIGVQAELKPTLIDNIWTLFYQNTFSPVAVPFIFMLAICASITFYNQKKSVFNLLLGLTPLAMLLIEAIPAFEKAVLIVLVCLPLLAQMLRLFMLRKYTYKTQVLSLIFVGLGSQIMLLISAIWGFRCMFSMYVIYMLLIMIFLQEMDKKAQRFILCSGITISIHPLLTVGYWCVTLLLQLMKKESVQTILSKILLRGSVISALVILLVGYARNVETHLQNLESTHNPVNQITTLKELPDDKYSWYFIPFGDFHEEYYRLLNHMSEDAKIEYIVIKAENKCP